MKVSVVIPCHNAEPYLAQALGSVLDQTRPADEIIVVDDGSTDGSLAVARNFEAFAPERVTVLAERSGHASRTRNIGALAATGDALMFLDADDVLAPDTLEMLGNALQQDAGGIAVCPWFRLQLIDGRWVSRPPTCEPRRAADDPLSAWLTGWYHPPCSVLWSRSAFEHAGRWDEQAAVNQDGDLMMRALVSGIPLLETGGGAAYYRRHPEAGASLSGTRTNAAGVAARVRAVRKTAYWLEDRGRLAAFRPALSAAFSRIAADARSRHPVLAARAERLAREYRRPALVRAARRMSYGTPPETAQQPRPAVPAVEVVYGVGRAAEVLRRAAGPGLAAATRGVTTLRRPLVTVIVPTFNRADLLPRAVDSVVAQTSEDFELLIVDDGSTDDTAGVVARYGDPRVRYLRQPENRGVSAARNRGIRESRGEFIAFLDSDDEWLPEKLALQLDRFGGLGEDVGLVYTGVERVREDGTRSVAYPEARGDVYRQLLWTNVIHGGGSNVMIRRAAVAAAGFFPEGIPAIEDYEYWLRIARFFKVDFVRKPLIRYHDPRLGGERRSLAAAANLEARWWFYRTHAAEMRRAGVAHLFLVRTARRALASPEPDVRAARRLARRAVAEKPVSRMALGMLIRASISRPSRVAPLRHER